MNSYYLIVFKNKSETMMCYKELKKYSVPCIIISTPRNLTVSCSQSVKFEKRYINFAKQILYRFGFNSFVGIFYINNNITQKII